MDGYKHVNAGRPLLPSTSRTSSTFENVIIGRFPPPLPLRNASSTFKRAVLQCFSSLFHFPRFLPPSEASLPEFSSYSSKCFISRRLLPLQELVTRRAPSPPFSSSVASFSDISFHLRQLLQPSVSSSPSRVCPSLFHALLSFLGRGMIEVGSYHHCQGT